jgi:CrcB protein
MSRWQLVALVALAGSAGTLARWGIASAANRLTPGWGWPGTLTVNLLGCLAFGIVFGLSGKDATVSPHVRAVVLIGFMGAFTTFSSMAFDTGELLRAGRTAAALANLAANNVLGMALFLAGAWLGGMLKPASA